MKLPPSRWGLSRAPPKKPFSLQFCLKCQAAESQGHLTQSDVSEPRQCHPSRYHRTRHPHLRHISHLFLLGLRKSNLKTPLNLDWLGVPPLSIQESSPRQEALEKKSCSSHCMDRFEVGVE
eukprot:TRINITY_DN37635_c0_g1_i1.p1 TRINITY_DN37635_c0_g1~~TRINITY_DN37635_c0_g1_i1.p1  ORF type:complete len:121 (+),score=6.48 TRINITY_DN37635_c0_g1_i1:54-416(+)